MLLITTECCRRAAHWACWHYELLASCLAARRSIEMAGKRCRTWRGLLESGGVARALPLKQIEQLRPYPPPGCNVPRSGGVSARRWGGDDASTGAHSGRSPSKLWKGQAEVSVRLKQRSNKRSGAGVRRDEIRQKPGPYIGQSTVPHGPRYGASIATATLIRSHRNPPPWRSASRPMCAGWYRVGPWSEPPAPASRRSAHGRA